MVRPRIPKEVKKKAERSVKDEPHHDDYVLCKRIGDGGLEVVTEGGINCRQLLLNEGDENQVLAYTNTSKEVQIRPAERTVASSRLAALSGHIPQPNQQDMDDVHHNIDDWRPAPRSIASTQSSDTSKCETDDEVPPKRTPTYSFKVSDTEKVKDYLYGRLQLLQQQADKQISKAWIKGICPKKQARYPYQNSIRKEREGKDPEVPEWWPSEVCVFREPDHIPKESRMKLCLHLLRLRPTPEKAREWSGSTERTSLTDTHEFYGWTEFLKQMTPVSLFDGLEPDKTEKKKRREIVLDLMYKVADMEERYFRDELDGDTMIQVPDEREPTTATKRSRPSSTAGGRTKRAKREVVVAHASPQGQLVEDMSNASLVEPARGRMMHPKPLRDQKMDYSRDLVPQGTSGPVPITGWRPAIARQYSDHSMVEAGPSTFPRCSSVDCSVGTFVHSQAPSPMNASFNSAQSDTHDSFVHGHQQESPITFPGNHDYTNPTHGMVHNFHADQAHRVPQPQFDTVPNTPMFSPMPLGQAPFPGYDGMQQCQQPLETTYVAGSQRYVVDNNGIMQPHPAAEPNGLPFAPAGFAVPEQQYGIAGALQHATQEVYDYKPNHQCPHQALHGLPAVYNGLQHPPPNEVSEYPYYEHRSDGTYPAAALPGSVHRGFTGHGSGIGGGAWT
ncbi:uncharacterized protein LTR77_008388 [Saxophila tyrrhenica]|uniref:Subtelomeric hrmA-associated cluster protein AFUB-079030/YDR124W-like helical bundle domain-containing protein n=1 Tax=Saxophila tyrrhenica TaxID=1690608 RepID=A0AAV9P436_9PEZI|nr:hypothetical protein LTR77_008388 [Saxophila tyrrhenica]